MIVVRGALRNARTPCVDESVTSSVGRPVPSKRAVTVAWVPRVMELYVTSASVGPPDCTAVGPGRPTVKDCPATSVRTSVREEDERRHIC